MTKKLISEFDPKGWKKLQQTMLAYGNAYFHKLSNKPHCLKDSQICSFGRMSPLCDTEREMQDRPWWWHAQASKHVNISHHSLSICRPAKSARSYSTLNKYYWQRPYHCSYPDPHITSTICRINNSTISLRHWFNNCQFVDRQALQLSGWQCRDVPIMHPAWCLK